VVRKPSAPTRFRHVGNVTVAILILQYLIILGTTGVVIQSFSCSEAHSLILAASPSIRSVAHVIVSFLLPLLNPSPWFNRHLPATASLYPRAGERTIQPQTGCIRPLMHQTIGHCDTYTIVFSLDIRRGFIPTAEC
jgi:hypothetical protein